MVGVYGNTLMECIHLFADKYLKIWTKPQLQTNNSHIHFKYTNHKVNFGFFFIHFQAQWEEKSTHHNSVGCRKQARAASMFHCHLYAGLTWLKWGGLGGFGQSSLYTGPSFSVCWLLQLCNRSHVSIFVHVLESRPLSGNDHGGKDLSLLLISSRGESYAERVKHVKWRSACTSSKSKIHPFTSICTTNLTFGPRPIHSTSDHREQNPVTLECCSRKDISKCIQNQYW